MARLETVSRIGVAQSLIGEMIELGKTDITPCNNCEYATKNGCIKGVDGPEKGPIYDQEIGSVVCPIQKGVIFVTNNNGHKSE